MSGNSALWRETVVGSRDGEKMKRSWRPRRMTIVLETELKKEDGRAAKAGVRSQEERF